MGRRARLANLAWDALRARAGGTGGITARRERRLGNILARARRTPLYRRLWSGIPERAELSGLPPVTKAEWVQSFEESVIDPEVTREDLWSYVQNPTRVGQPWRGRYTVCRSSGVSGRKSLFLADQDAMDVYWALWLTRGWLPWLGPAGVARLGRRGGRVASLIATNGHFASAAMIRRPSPLGAIADVRSATLSILKPVSRLARALEHLRPAAIIGYPTLLEQLAARQREEAGALDLVLAVSVSEWIEPAARRRIEEGFGCPLRDSYAASEFLAIGFYCPARWLHVNADWVVLEAVDEDMRPVLPGQASHTALLTNAGEAVTVAPMGLVVTTGSTPGIEAGYQFVQTGPRELSVRIAFRPEAVEADVWRELERRLRSHLRSLGLAAVEVVRSPVPPGRDERTGKLRKTWSELPVAAP
ncbi:hypothetical protein BH20GEM1_BH20GEM1_12270 [soil metagenome]